MRVRLTSLLLSGLLMLSAATGNMVARTSAAPSTRPAAVVLSYFGIFSNVLRGADPTQFAQVYAPNASFYVSTTTGKTSAFHKLPAIEGWYKTFAATHVGFTLQSVSQETPLPGMVVHYEIALNADHVVKGRCVHIFAVSNGMITRDDFVVYAGYEAATGEFASFCLRQGTRCYDSLATTPPSPRPLVGNGNQAAARWAYISLPGLRSKEILRHMQVGELSAMSKQPTEARTPDRILDSHNAHLTEPRGVSRRSFLGKAGTVAAAGAAAGMGVATPTSAAAHESAAATQSYPFYGPHQGGIATPAQDYIHLAAFDFIGTGKSDLAELLSEWSKTAAALSAGDPAGNPGTPGFNRALPPSDTGEALGLGAAHLTVTIGFGPSLFSKVRFGRGVARPAPLAPLPSFRRDKLDPAYCRGDLVVQACANHPQSALHAIRMLTRNAQGVATPRWTQQGFLPARETTGTPRNLLGFKDGTGNLKIDDPAAMAEHVWVGPSDGPDWMRGGSYMVVRRIRMQLETWDQDPLQNQEQTIGRYKMSGAPLGAHSEVSPIDLRAVNQQGAPFIPPTSHIRLAHQGTERILRRGYSFSDGLDPRTGGLEAGLLFICFQRDPRRQFVPIQTRLAARDALNDYIIHTGSALFACPPGARVGSYVGEGLLTP